MIKLVIIADDFTGALDTGVQFSKQGVKTLVTTNAGIDFGSVGDDIEVLSVDVESRHIDKKDAYDAVRRVARAAIACGVRCVYKKTDSTLRGNIGAELAALLDESRSDALMFVPAFPKGRRTTVGGIQYVEGKPVAETGFANDPIDPVRFSNIADIIATQTDAKTVSVPLDGLGAAAGAKYGEPTICVFDAVTDVDMQNIGEELSRNGRLAFVAGCAGFAERLPGLLGLEKSESGLRAAAGRVLLAAGSVNQVSVDQLAAGRVYGYKGITLTPEQKLERSPAADAQRGEVAEKLVQGVVDTGKMMLQAITVRDDMFLSSSYAEKNGIPSASVPKLIAESMGIIVKEVLDKISISTLVVFGGDTLLAIMDKLGADGIMPFAEITPGVVASKVISDRYDFTIVTKAGGFGGTGVVEAIDKYVNAGQD